MLEIVMANVLGKDWDEWMEGYRDDEFPELAQLSCG
jgi:hypothetical protein